MAEIILSVIAKGVLETITSLIISEISLAWGAKNELRKLGMTLSTIKAVLMDAEAQQAKNHEVRDWLEKLKDVVCDVEDVLDDFSTEALRRKMEVKGSVLNEISTFFSRSNSIVYHFNFGHKIKEIRERLDDISTDRNKFHFREHVPDVRVENNATEQTYSFVRVSDVIGRENDKENIIKHLLSSSVGDSLSVIPLVGLGGLGKTTLAQLAYNDDRIVGHFEIKMWVCVSVEFDMRKIVEMILKCTRNANYGNLDLDQMISCLRDDLHTKRFLLVLDDVWNEEKTKWTKLKSLLMNGVSGSKIIVTTRSMVVAMIMGTFPPYKLQGLSDGECLSILVRCAFQEGREKQHPKLIEIGKAIVRKCGGIPLAVVTLGCMLYGTIDEREWFAIRDNEIWTFQQNENDILPALMISYKQLPSYLKQCFSYCCIFSKDTIFDRQFLINFWMAHGLLQSPDSNCQLEDIGNRYLNELLSRSFFQDNVRNFDSTINTCKMHDLVHDLARMVAGTECLDVNFNTKKISERVRHMSFHETNLSMEEFPRSLVNAKNLRSFHLAYEVGNINKAFLDKLISTFKCMRFLNLSSSEFKELPDFVGNLKHLRSLSLSDKNSSIKTLPNSICKLVNLQSLYLDGCEELQDLPKDFGKLISLRHLSLTSKLVSLPEKGLQGLTSLQLLFLYKCNHLASLSEGIRYLTSLRELHIQECPVLTSLPSGMKYLISLEKLGIWNCQELNLLEGEEDMQGLRSLRNLSINGLPKLQALPKGLLQSASTLQYFNINNCVGLTTLPEWMQTLTSLRVLYILNCDNLMSLPLGIQQLTNLQQLNIRGSPHLIKRCKKQNGEDWRKISHVPKIFGTWWRWRQTTDSVISSTLARP